MRTRNKNNIVPAAVTAVISVAILFALGASVQTVGLTVLVAVGMSMVRGMMWHALILTGLIVVTSLMTASLSQGVEIFTTPQGFAMLYVFSVGWLTVFRGIFLAGENLIAWFRKPAIQL
jgi:hypothetical protein